MASIHSVPYTPLVYTKVCRPSTLCFLLAKKVSRVLDNKTLLAKKIEIVSEQLRFIAACENSIKLKSIKPILEVLKKQLFLHKSCLVKNSAEEIAQSKAFLERQLLTLKSCVAKGKPKKTSFPVMMRKQIKDNRKSIDKFSNDFCLYQLRITVRYLDNGNWSDAYHNLRVLQEEDIWKLDLPAVEGPVTAELFNKLITENSAVDNIIKQFRVEYPSPRGEPVKEEDRKDFAEKRALLSRAIENQYLRLINCHIKFIKFYIQKNSWAKAYRYVRDIMRRDEFYDVDLHRFPSKPEASKDDLIQLLIHVEIEDQVGPF